MPTESTCASSGLAKSYRFRMLRAPPPSRRTTTTGRVSTPFTHSRPTRRLITRYFARSTSRPPSRRTPRNERLPPSLFGILASRETPSASRLHDDRADGVLGGGAHRRHGNRGPLEGSDQHVQRRSANHGRRGGVAGRD